MKDKPNYPQFITCAECEGIAEHITSKMISEKRIDVNYICRKCKIKITRKYFSS